MERGGKIDLDNRNFFFKQEMELSLIGLQNVGNTSLVNVIVYYWMKF